MRKTKIIATIGPASQDYDNLKALMLAGMNACRINFSHGSHEEHGPKIDRIKELRKELGLPIPLILDTKGPEIRIGEISNAPVILKKDSTFTLTTDDIIGDETKASVTYKGLTEDLKAGATVLIDDGLIELTVKEISGSNIICNVENTAELSSKKGVNIPDFHLNLPALTEKDINDILFGINKGFDYVAASFIRSAKDVLAIRKVLDDNGGEKIHIISKIENRAGVNNIDEILEISDGIMVARGDLGVEIPLEEVPVIQKMLIKKCKLAGKPVITATQMLESMINNPRPTRAEASDVANAVYDGTDAIMLSGETAQGDFPVEAVSTMVKITEKIESSINYVKRFDEDVAENPKNTITSAISHATCSTANDLNAACIVAVTNSGYTANKIAKNRPTCPILALSPNEQVVRQLNIIWGCYPFSNEMVITNASDLFQAATEKATEKNFAVKGDTIVIVGGTPLGTTGTTNTMKVQVVGDKIGSWL